MKMTDLVKFNIKSINDDYIETPKGNIIFYKLSPPNISILSEFETLGHIAKFKSLLKNIPDIPVQIFITDRTEDLSDNKAYWTKVDEKYAFIGESITKTIEATNSNATNGIQRGFYLVIQASEQHLIDRFESTARNCEFICERLNKQENINLLRAFFLRDFNEFPIENFGKESEERYDELRKKEKKKTTKEDFELTELTKRLLPTNMVVKYDCIEQSDFFRQTWLVKNMQLSFEEICVMRRVAQIKNTTISIRMSEMNKSTAVSLIDKQIKDTASDVRNSTGTKGISADTENSSIKEFYREFKRDNDKMFYLNIYVEMYGHSKDELGQVATLVKNSLDTMSFEMLNSEQEAGFKGICPLTQDTLKVLANNIPTSSLAALYPFSYSTRTDKQGMLLGKTDDGGYMFVDLDFRSPTVTNGNIFISGESGYGKSYLCKKVINQFLAKPSVRKKRMFTFDYENEYGDVISTMGGININAIDARYIINPLQIRTFQNSDYQYEETEEDGEVVPKVEAFEKKTYLSQHLSWFKDFLKYVIPHLEGKDLDLMMAMTSDMYKFKGITDDTDFSKLDPQDYPIFSDLYNYIEKVISDKKNYSFYKLYGDDMIAGCLLMLRELVTGSLAPMFNGYTTLPDEEIININIQELSLGDAKRTQAYLFNMMTYIWSKIIKKDMDTMLLVDELYLLCDAKFPMAMQYLRNFMKRARKYLALIVCATQQLGDVSAPELYLYTSALFNTPSFKFMFNPGELDLDNYKKLTKLSDSKIKILQECKKKECLVYIGIDVYKMVVGTLEYEEVLFGAGGGR